MISSLRYLHRFDQELEKINEQNSIKGRQGRAHASREDTLNTIIERERELYDTCGIGENKSAKSICWNWRPICRSIEDLAI